MAAGNADEGDDAAMKALFIGGTGRLSKDVASRAADEGWDVYLLTRGSPEREKFVRKEYHMLRGDIRDPERTKEILKDYQFDVVIDFISYDCEQLARTLDVVKGRFDQFVFISTAAVYADIKAGEAISEERTSVGNRRWRYAWNKVLCEWLLEERLNAGPEWYTIIRPAVTYGNTRIPYPVITQKPDREWSFIDRILNGKKIVSFDHGRTRAMITHTRDFAVGAVGLFQNPGAKNEAVHITASAPVTLGEILDDLEEILETPVLRCELTQAEIFAELPYYRDILEGGGKGMDRVFDNSRICGLVPAFRAQTPLRDGLSEMVSFYREHPDMRLIDWHWNGEMDRLCRDTRWTDEMKTLDARSRLNYCAGRYRIVDRAKKAYKRVFQQEQSYRRCFLK